MYSKGQSGRGTRGQDGGVAAVKIQGGCVTITPTQLLREFFFVLQKPSVCKPKLVLRVEQVYLLRAAEGVKPSVSTGERQRYNEM